MADKVDPQVIDTLTIESIETTATSSSLGMATLFQHQVNHARRLDSMAEAYLGKAIKRLAFVNPTEAVSVAKIFQGESDSSIGSLLAQLSAGQQEAKIAQSTPGELANEISKMGAAVASLNGLIGGIVALLQQTIKGAMSTPSSSVKPNPAPVVNPAPAPLNAPYYTEALKNGHIDIAPLEAPSNPTPNPNDHYNPPYWPNKTFPSVTIRY
jgi:hypothetical protein